MKLIVNKYLDLKNYYEFFIKIVFLLVSPIIKIWEKKYFNKYGNQPLSHVPVFIIGAPRTGSTILYQSITNQLDVLYIDNLVCRLNRNFFFGFWLSNIFFKQKAHNSFKSNHGDTSKSGFHAPSECGDFWYRWLPKDRHFIDYSDITEEMIREIRIEIASVINYFGKPIIFKNLNAGQRLRLIKKCFPEAKFIFVNREPIYTSQSILKAKRKLKICDNTFWSVKPKNYLELEKLKSYEQIVGQIFYLEKQINDDSKLYSKDSFLKINYQGLEKEFEHNINNCKRFINCLGKLDFNKSEIKISEKYSIKEKDITELNKEINKYNWIDYNEK